VEFFGQFGLENTGEDSKHEEGQPAEDENAHDNTECFSRSLFMSEPRQLDTCLSENALFCVDIEQAFSA